MAIRKRLSSKLGRGCSCALHHRARTQYTHAHSMDALVWWNVSDSHNCSGDPLRDSCHMSQAETGQRDVIAGVRLVVSVLSILGACSIIISAIAKKQVLSPKVHPIFVLSIADLMLAVLWVVGGTLWLRGGVSRNRVGCFTVSLMTPILECVAVNLTLVYALLAYSGIKRKDFSNVYMVFERSNLEHIWKPYITVIVYVIAWVLPVVLIMIPFGIIAGVHHIVHEADSCSCWCEPYFGNVVPLAHSRDKPTSTYVYHMRMFITSYAVVVGTNYLVVFVLLVIIYYKILKRIKRMRIRHEQTRSTYNLYGATETRIIRGQSQARKKVIYFLTVFTISGFFNVLLSYAFFIYEAVRLNSGEAVLNHQTSDSHVTSNLGFSLYILQSITVPLQGFLNAIVYGWTREDFLYVMVRTSLTDTLTEVEQPEDDVAGMGDSGILISTEEYERSLEYSLTQSLTSRVPNINTQGSG